MNKDNISMTEMSEEEVKKMVEEISGHYEEIRKFAHKRYEIKMDYIMSRITPGDFYNFYLQSGIDDIAYMGIIIGVEYNHLDLTFSIRFTGIEKTYENDNTQLSWYSFKEIIIPEDSIDDFLNGINKISESDFLWACNDLKTEIDKEIRHSINNWTKKASI